MRIGIITFWQSQNNYGQVLQAYALQTYLRSLGHDPFIIKFDQANQNNRASAFENLKAVFLPVLKSILIKIPLIKDCRRVKEWKSASKLESNDKRRGFEAFKSRYFSFSNQFYHGLASLQEDPPEADCYITGSDQVFSRLLSNSDNRLYYLDFGCNSIKKYAYAASSSMSEYPKDLQQVLHDQLTRLTKVGVREYTGVDICRKVGIVATKVCDPTILLSGQEYIPLFERIEHERPFVYVYSLNIRTPEEIRFFDLKQEADERDLRILVTPSSGYIPGYEIYGAHVVYEYSTIGRWLFNINEAVILVTPSFHGIVFSILLHTPFVYVPLSGIIGNGNDRILDLLSDLGLEDRILTNNTDYKALFSSQIDWDMVEIRLNKMRWSSKEFLDNI